MLLDQQKTITILIKELIEILKDVNFEILVINDDSPDETHKRLLELQNQVDLKGFRKGKVPPSVIKNQFGKAIYGEVVDKVLKESTTKAIQDKKLKVAGQPKIDLKTFGEGKDLNFELQLDLLPEIKLDTFEKYKISEYFVKVSKDVLEDRLENLSKEYKSFENKKCARGSPSKTSVLGFYFF